MKTHARQLGGRSWCGQAVHPNDLVNTPPTCRTCQTSLKSVGLDRGAQKTTNLRGVHWGRDVLDRWAARRAG